MAAAATAASSSDVGTQPHPSFSNYNILNNVFRYACTSFSRAQSLSDVTCKWRETISDFSPTVWSRILEQDRKRSGAKGKQKRLEDEDIELLGDAAERGLEVVVMHVVQDRGCDVNSESCVPLSTRDSEWGYCLLATPLLRAAASPYISNARRARTVRALLSLGAEPNESLASICHRRSRYERTSITSHLYLHGWSKASVASRVSRGLPLIEGTTPLHCLARRKDAETIAALFACGELVRKSILEHNAAVKQRLMAESQAKAAAAEAAAAELAQKQAEEREKTRAWLETMRSARKADGDEGGGGDEGAVEDVTRSAGGDQLPAPQLQPHLKKLLEEKEEAHNKAKNSSRNISGTKVVDIGDDNDDDAYYDQVFSHVTFGPHVNTDVQELIAARAPQFIINNMLRAHKMSFRYVKKENHNSGAKEMEQRRKLLEETMIPVPPKVDPVAVDVDGNTPLLVACSSKQPGSTHPVKGCEAVALLLQLHPKYVDYRRDKDAYTPMMLCCRASNVPAARALFWSIAHQYDELQNTDPAATQIDVHAVHGPTGCTAMHFAAEVGSKVLCGMLYDAGAEMRVLDKLKRGPADRAAAKNFTQLAAHIKKTILEEADEDYDDEQDDEDKYDVHDAIEGKKQLKHEW